MRILITDAGQRVALTLIQSYGRLGHEVNAAERSTVANPAGFFSRYVKKVIRLEPERELERLLEEAARVDVTIPVSISSLFLVAENRKSFEAVTNLAVPSLETLDRINDSGSLAETCRRIHVPAPKTKRVAKAEEAVAAIRSLGLPAVIKIPNDRETRLSPQDRYRVIRKEAQIGEAVRSILSVKGEALVQEFISGLAVGYHAVCSGGTVLTRCGHLRIRESPPSGGPSTCCVSYYHPEVSNAAERLLSEFKYTGVAMVEFKQDPVTGKAFVLEVNPRFWGTFRLTGYCQVDFPNTYLQLAQGLPVKRQLDYRTGVKMRFMPLDLRFALESAAERRWIQLLGVFRDLFDPRIRPGLFCSDDARPVFQLMRESFRAVSKL